MTTPDRSAARRFATEAIEAGKPLSWFERLYAASEDHQVVVPWADPGPNPHLLRWAQERAEEGIGRSALVVGCGLGDDAEALAEMGWEVIAFDVAPTAVRLCQQRFPNSAVAYKTADLLAPPAEWIGAFDLVFEANTVQALPESAVRRQAIEQLSRLVAPGGELVVVARARDEGDELRDLPWPLTRTEVLACGAHLALQSLDDFFDEESPPVRRFVATFRAPAL